ncbi:MAG TPA: MFS transporter [Longimicrobiales bacterium]
MSGHEHATAGTASRASRLAVGSWVLYDLANTIFSMNIASLYMALWVVNVMHAGDTAWSLANSLSMAVVFVASPLLGALTDQASRRMPFLVASTAICVALTFLLGTGGLATSLTLFAIANIAYQAGLQFYDALLPEVSTEENRGRISGIGIGVGYLGALLGVLIGRALLAGVDDLPAPAQTDRYVLVFRATALLFLAFAMPCFLFVRERRRNRRFSAASVGAAARQVADTFRSGRRYPGLLRFLVGRAFYADAIYTVITFLGVYVTNEVGFSTDEATIVLVIAILAAAPGGMLWGRVVDRIGPKRTLDRVLYLWMFVFFATAAFGLLGLPPALFWPVPALAGIALGGTWAADRPYMLRLSPPSRIGEFYGLYGMVGRFSAIAGPLVWALVADRLGLGRPAAVLTLLGAVVLSYRILRPVSDAPRDWSADEVQYLHSAANAG